MSKSWDDAMTRLSNVEGAVEALRTDARENIYAAPSRRRDDQIETRIDRVGRMVVSVPLNLWTPVTASGSDTLVVKTSDQTGIGSTFADVTGLGFTVAANTAYAFVWYLICTADATTTGIDVACNGPAGPTEINYIQRYWTSTTNEAVRGAVAYDNDTTSVNSNGATKRIFTVEGILRNGATAGTLIPRIKREAVGSGPDVYAGSYGTLRVLA